MRLRNSLAVLLSAAALAFAACEKSNEAVLQEQYEEALGSCPQGCVVPPEGCLIKGNTGRTGVKYYIVPENLRYYNDVIVDTELGDRWFCTEQEARANGYQKAPN